MTDTLTQTAVEIFDLYSNLDEAKEAYTLALAAEREAWHVANHTTTDEGYSMIAWRMAVNDAQKATIAKNAAYQAREAAYAALRVYESREIEDVETGYDYPEYDDDIRADLYYS